MSNFTVGRVGLDVQVDSVTGWSEQGSRVSVDGRTRYGSVAEALVVRQQLLGYVDAADESFVPVTWAEQPQVDGFYRVLNAQVTATPEAAFAGVYAFSVELEKVTGFAAPLIESTVLGKKRVATFGVTQRNVVGVPAAAKSYVEYYPASRVLIPQSVDVARVGCESTVSVFYHGGGTASDMFISQYYVAPKHFYDAAATLRVGDPLRVAVGREIGNYPGNWELSNDIFQVRPVGGPKFRLEFRMWDVSAWSAWRTVALHFADSAGDMVAPHTITVLANGPEAVTVRLITSTGANGDYAPVTVDMTLRRGARYVAVELHSVFTSDFSLRVSGFDAATLTYGSIWQGDGAGVSSFMASPKKLGYGVVGSDGKVFPYEDAVTGVDQWSFCLGMVNGGELIQTQLNEYYWAVSEKQSVVAR